MDKKEIKEWLYKKIDELVSDNAKLHSQIDKCKNCKKCEESELPVLFCGMHGDRVSKNAHQTNLIKELLVEIDRLR